MINDICLARTVIFEGATFSVPAAALFDFWFGLCAVYDLGVVALYGCRDIFGAGI